MPSPRSPLPVFLGLLAVLGALLAGRALLAGGQRPAEPESVQATRPARSATQRTPEQARAAASAATSAAASAAIERRDLGIPIDHTRCEEVAKHGNELFGRPETDAKGVQLLMSCLRGGNLAFYRCAMGARSTDELTNCSVRLLGATPNNPPPSPARR
jgi:hypothetical protein